jgi:hypothetical protein
MNYFGLFFSFMIPGMLIGWMTACCVKEAAEKRNREQQAVRTAPQRRRKLYVYDLSEGQKKAAA